MRDCNYYIPSDKDVNDKCSSEVEYAVASLAVLNQIRIRYYCKQHATIVIKKFVENGTEYNSVILKTEVTSSID